MSEILDYILTGNVPLNSKILYHSKDYTKEVFIRSNEPLECIGDRSFLDLVIEEIHQNNRGIFKDMVPRFLQVDSDLNFPIGSCRVSMSSTLAPYYEYVDSRMMRDFVSDFFQQITRIFISHYGLKRTSRGLPIELFLSDINIIRVRSTPFRIYIKVGISFYFSNPFLKTPTY